VLAWIRSFLSDRSQQVLSGGCLSAVVFLLFGVPHGSVLGPLLFVLYTVEVLHIIASCGLIAQCYADDTQLYISVPVSAATEAAARLVKCVERLDLWMVQNRLKLNADKTQLIWLGTRQQLANMTVSQLETSASILDIGDRAIDHDVLLDGQLSMALHTAAVCRSSYYQMRQLWSIKVSNNHCSPGTSSSLRALSARLLQRTAGWCC